jgi:cell division transport system permease protein
MAISTGYMVREAGANMRRNLLMTVAAILTMVVSLFAAGSVLVMRQAIHTQTLQFANGVEVDIFLKADATPNEISAVDQLLHSSPMVRRFHYVDKQQAYVEFKKIFGADHVLVDATPESAIPPSYRVVPARTQDIAAITQQFQAQPGVISVTSAAQEIGALQHKFNTDSAFALILAVLVMVGAIALIVNTIQLAIFARRREVAVMKLVGATNWFIRIPFMLEGLIDGVVGAIVAFVAVFVARNQIAQFVGNQSLLEARLYVTGHQAVLTGLVILVVGAAVGALGSAFAVRRFLQV